MKTPPTNGFLFLFNPYLNSIGRAKYRNPVMAALYAQRGIQEECTRCVKTCKVLKALSDSKSKFICMDNKT